MKNLSLPWATKSVTVSKITVSKGRDTNRVKFGEIYLTCLEDGFKWREKQIRREMLFGQEVIMRRGGGGCSRITSKEVELAGRLQNCCFQ